MINVVSPYKILKEEDLFSIQRFLDKTQDFFLLCEGQKINAEGLLTSCPKNRNPELDKLVIGLIENNALIGLVDIIKDYPSPYIWTIGYLLIDPDFRNQQKGSTFVEFLKTFKMHGAQRLRCIVQKQNPQALDFWTKNGFIITTDGVQDLGLQENKIFILEKSIAPRF